MDSYNPSENIRCICSTDPYCQASWKFFEIHPQVYGYYLVASYIVPGSVVGCFSVESLLLSTLECLYSNSNCLTMLLYYTRYNEYLYVDKF
jgi:hypothetical protein